MIIRRNAEMPLKAADIERAEITLTRHVQRSVFRCVCTQLSLDVEEYIKAVSKIKHTEMNR